MLDDCEHMIDGWYDDGKYENTGIRWEAHEEEDIANHIVLIDNFGDDGLMKITNDQGLKAAHGKDAKDKFSYPGLDKQVGDDDEPMNDEDVDAAAGQTVNFQLTSNVPDDLRNYLKPEPVDPPVIEGDEDEQGTPEDGTLPEDEQQRGSYTLTFHDVMNEMLTNPGSFVVTIGTEGSETIPLLTLVEGEHYDIIQDPTDTCTFEITLDLAKLYELGKEKGINIDAYIDNTAPITVTYQATLSKNAVSGQFENKAWVTAPNWKTSEDVVYVNTYAIKIFKYDQADSKKGLSGAEFELALNGEKLDKKITSGEDGYVVVGGLDVGDYTLTETKAPDGYVCSETPLEISVPDNATNYIVNVSFANSLIPHTGGMGTTLFSIVGGALIATAGIVFFVSRRKKSHTA